MDSEDARLALANETLEAAVAEWLTAHSETGSVLVEGFILFAAGSAGDDLTNHQRQIRVGIPHGQTWWTSFGLLKMLEIDMLDEYNQTD